MFRALHAFVNKIHWLKDFKYDGQTEFENKALECLRELEAFVAKRAKSRKIGEERRLRGNDV